MPQIARPFKGRWIALFPILAVFLALVLPTLSRQGANWDEQTDLDIASVYAASDFGMLYGSRDDLINTRLPMFSAGLLFRVLSADRLMLARGMSVAVALLGLVGVYLLCLRLFDTSTAWVAAALLATSPYYLYFSKQALSEGDIWISTAVVWFLVAYQRFRDRPDLGRSAWVGLSLGLALSAKISALSLFGVVVGMLWLDRRALAAAAAESRPNSHAFDLRDLLLALSAFLVWVVANAIVSVAVNSGFGLSLAPHETRPLMRVLSGMALALLVGRWIFLRRRTRTLARWYFVVVSLVAGLTFFLVPFVHTSNPWFLGALGHQILSSDSSPGGPSLLDSAAFHLGVIVLKSSLVLGVVFLLGWLRALSRFRRRRALQPLLLASVCYTAFVLMLPWAQTRYMMPVYPLLAICASLALVELFRARRALALLLGAASAACLVTDFVLCYPDLNLNGYPVVGERYLMGRSTVGYRGLVHTPSDGIEQSLEWVRGRAGKGQVIMTVFGESHITRQVFAGTGLEWRSALHESVGLEEVDWVVTSINYDIAMSPSDNPGGTGIYGYPHYDRRQLEREFERVFVVERAFGIGTAAVWRRSEAREEGTART